MGYLVGIALPLLLLVVAAGIARHEISLYRECADLGSEVLAYTRSRLARRMFGILVIVSIAVTLGAMELSPAETAAGANAYVALLMCEVLLLLVMAVWDLAHTARRRKRRREQLR